MKRTILTCIPLLFLTISIAPIENEFIFTNGKPTVASLNALLQKTSFKVLQQDTINSRKMIQFTASGPYGNITLEYSTMSDSLGYFYGESRGQAETIFQFWQQVFNPSENKDSAFLTGHGHWKRFDYNQGRYLIVQLFCDKKGAMIYNRWY